MPTPNDMPRTLTEPTPPEHDCDANLDASRVHCNVCGYRVRCCDDH